LFGVFILPIQCQAAFQISPPKGESGFQEIYRTFHLLLFSSPSALCLWLVFSGDTERDYHFWVNDSSPIFLFWHLLMAVDISATAQQGKNGNPDLPTPVNCFLTHARQYLLPVTQAHRLHVTVNSFPPIHYLVKPRLWFLLSFRLGFPSHPHNFSQPLFSPQYIYTTVTCSVWSRNKTPPHFTLTFKMLL